MMAGLKPFTEQMRKHVPPDRYAKASEALQRIDQLTAGAAIPFMGFGAKPAPKAKPTAGVMNPWHRGPPKANAIQHVYFPPRNRRA